ncbi:MAG: hypothetical protein ACREOD_06240, partial [Candidatus Dormibacteria bacterium]
KHQRLLDLGLRPHYLGDTLLDSVIKLVEEHAERVDPVLLERPSVLWRTGGNEVWRKYSRQDRPTVVRRRALRRPPAKVRAAV